MSVGMILSSCLSPEGKTQKPTGSKSLHLLQHINTALKIVSITTPSLVFSTVKNNVVAVLHTKIPHLIT